MDIYMIVLTITGLAFLGAAWVPLLVYRGPLSFPALYVAFGFLLFSLPLGLYLPNPLEDSFFVERFTEILVIISLTAAGLKLRRPIGWRSWQTTWRLLLFAMPFTIGLAALLGWWAIGLAPASAILLGAVLAPTDPVLASDVQTGPPGDENEGETRFTLTSEAGLNDGFAFPFTHLALVLAAASLTELGGRLGEWLLYYLLFKVTVGVIVGRLIGLALARFVFRLPSSPGSAASRETFVVAGITLLAYGVTELLHGYGFLGVFVAALTLRHEEVDHPSHQGLHDFASGLERLMMTLMLILFGGLVAQGLFSGAGWPIVAVAGAIILVVRPLTGYISLLGLRLPRIERAAMALFGIRGIGSFYYLSYALNRQEFPGAELVLQTVSATVLLSIALHGGTASVAMAHLDRNSQAEKDETD